MKNLKRIKNSVLILTLFSLTMSFSQNGSGFGIKGGLNYGGNGDYFESISENYQSPDENIGYHVGIFGKIGDKLYLRPELIYTALKSNYDAGTFNFKKIDAPILVGAKIIGPLHAFGGPSLQYITNSDFEDATIETIEEEFSVGLNFGIGVNINKIGLDLRYERGFNDNEATIINNNVNINNPNRLSTRPEQLILSLSILL